ncbi:hypothetical protein FACS189487_00610 [Campylobacterota bacterium]|nr:hypothetical protein FACS189487_00610 [Campylobacterota bacterium]
MQMIFKSFLVCGAFMIALFLCGCGDTELKDSDEIDRFVFDTIAEKNSYAVSGRLGVNIYLTGDVGEGDELPIMITDGHSFAAYINGALSGKKIYMEVGGVTREVVVTAAPGETQFIAI